VLRVRVSDVLTTPSERHRTPHHAGRAILILDRCLSEPAVTDRQGIGFGWLQNAWLLHARLKIHRGGIDAPSMASTENPRAGSLSRAPQLPQPPSSSPGTQPPRALQPPSPQPAPQPTLRADQCCRRRRAGGRGHNRRVRVHRRDDAGSLLGRSVTTAQDRRVRWQLLTPQNSVDVFTPPAQPSQLRV
jgi:hypothetical protein